MGDTDRIEFVSTRELVVMLRRCQHHLEVTMDQALQGMVTVHVLPKGRKRLRLCRDATKSVITNIEDRLSMEERATLAGLLTRAERAFQPPPPRVRPWWLD